MYRYPIQDPTGRVNHVIITGPTPTATEQARIDAYLSGQPIPSRVPEGDVTKPGIMSLLGKGIGRGIDKAQAGIFTGLEGLAENAEDRSFLGRTPEEYRILADEQRRQADEIDPGIEGGFFDQEGAYDKARLLSLTLGESLPAMVGGAAAIIGGSAFGPAGTAAGTALAAAMYSPQLLNDNAERQIEEHGYIKDWDKAAAATAVGAVAEGLADRLTLGVAGVLGRTLPATMRSAITKGMNRGLTRVAQRIGAGAAVGALSEMPTEVLQSYLGRLQAEMPTDDPEAMEEYIEGAVVGGILGGGFGGAIGAGGGVAEIRQNARMAEARKDALEEQQQLAARAGTGEDRIDQFYQGRYPAPEPEPEAPGVAGLLPDYSAQRTREQAYLAAKGQSDVSGQESSQAEIAEATRATDKSPNFTEEEYLNAINELRGEKISPNKIASKLNVKHARAKGIYDALLARNDAVPSGNYARITTPPEFKSRASSATSGKTKGENVSREFHVRPVDSLAREPYSISVNGRKLGATFRTEEDARSFARDQKLGKFDIDVDTSGQQFGLYEDVYVDKDGERVRSGTRVLDTFTSEKEANQAVRELDPHYSPETNRMMQEAARKDLARQQRAEDDRAIEQSISKYLEKTIGKDRVEFILTPEVGQRFLAERGIDPSSVPEDGMIEATIFSDRSGQGLKNIIAASRNYLSADPLQAEEQLKALVGGHEVVHALRNFDLLKASEWKALDDLARKAKVPGKNYTWYEKEQARHPDTPLDPEEAVAEMLRHAVTNPTAFDTKTRGLLQKLIDFVKKMLGFANGREARQVIADILSGEVGTRETGSGGMGPRSRDVFYSQIASNPFYLKTERFIAGLKQDKAPAKQWLGMLKNAGVKKEEKEWLGLEDWLMSLGDTVVPRTELQNFIKANAAEIVVDRRGITDPALVKAARERFEKAEAALLDLWQTDPMFAPAADGKVTSDELRNWFIQGMRSNGYDPIQRFAKIKHEQGNAIGSEYLAARHERDLSRQTTSKWGSYTIPDGENYQEFLIRIPSMSPVFVNESHFQDPNIIAHLRTTDRMDGDQKGLFIEEIQSDLHQEGRRSGYAPPNITELLNANYHELKALSEERQRLLDEFLAGRMSDADYERLSDAADERMGQIRRHNYELRNETPKIPDAPFKTSWEEFGLKNLIQYAAKNNYDFIAWHGEHDSIGTTENYKIERVTDGYDNEGNEITGEKFLIDPSGQNVTAIVNRYLEKLPRIAKQLANKFNSILEVNDPSVSRETPRPNDWLEVEGLLQDAVPDKEDLANAADFLRRSWDEMVSTIDDSNEHIIFDAEVVVEAWESANQSAINQRRYNPLEAFGDTDEAIIRDGVRWLQTGTFPTSDTVEGKLASEGPYKFRNYRLILSEPMKEAFIRDDVPRFSMVPRRKQELMVDPAFNKWFGDSMIREDDGSPMVVYHGTITRHDFSEFNDLSHFGTLAAATDRVSIVMSELHPEGFTKIAKDAGVDVTDPDTLNGWWENLRGEDRLQKVANAYPDLIERLRIYPVMLRIENPVEIYDSSEGHSPEAYISALFDADYITQDEYLRLTRGTRGEIKRKLFEWMDEKGHDGFLYENTVEDPGSISMVPLRSNQIKSIFNTGSFNPDDYDIRYSAVQYSAAAPMGERVPLDPPKDTLAKVETGMTYNNLVPLLQKLVDKVPLISGRAKVIAKNKLEGTFINMQDRMLSVGDLVDRVRKNGGFITNDSDVYLREQLFSGQTDERLTQQKKAVYDPLLNAIGKLDVTKEDALEAGRLNEPADYIIKTYKDHRVALAELYLYAQHAQERNALMAARNANVADDRPIQAEQGSGMSDEEAQQILDWFTSKPFGTSFNSTKNPASIRSHFRKLIASTNDIRVDGGLNIDFRTARDENGAPYNTYTDYAPLKGLVELDDPSRELDEEYARIGKGYRIAGKEDISALGRRTLGSDLIGHAILQNEEAVIRAEKNKVAMAMVNLLRQNNPQMEVGARGSDNPRPLKDIAEIIDVRPTKYVYDRKTGLVRRAPDMGYRSDDQVLIAKEGGKEIAVRIHDPRIAKAMMSKGTMGAGVQREILNGLLRLNRMLGAVRTSYNPEFMVSNFLRDLTAATTNLNEFEVEGIKKEIISKVFPAIKGIWGEELAGRSGGHWQDVYADFRKYGGKTAYYGLKELEDTIKRMNAAMVQEMGGNPQRWSMQAIKGVGNFVEGLNVGVENGIRVATFEALRNRFLDGASDPATVKRANERAALIAKNLTVNFNMGGDSKPFLNSLYLFYNASFQGTMALVNPLIRSKKVRRMWAAVFTAGLLQDVLMSMLSPEDEDGIKQYDKVPDYVLEHNLVYMDPFGISERGYFKIPLPYVLNGIYNAGRAVAAGARGKYTPGEAVGSAFGTMISSLDPFGGANTFINFVAPTVLDPVVDLSNNLNFAGAPISPPENPFGVSPKDSQRYWNNTSPLYVTIADWLSRLSGGAGDYHEGKLEFSPNTIEYWAEWLGGGALTFATRAVDLVAPAPAGKGVMWEAFSGGEWAANDVPFARKFYGNVTTREDTQFYINNRDRVLKVRAELQDAIKSGDAARYQETVRRFPAEYRLAAQINRIESARKKISREINKIRSNTKIPEQRRDELVRLLKTRQDELVGRANGLLRGAL